jgi:signal transduction histidine kinase/CheY-like chemotaxis protein
MKNKSLSISQKTILLGFVPSTLISLVLIGFFIFTRFDDTIKRFDEKGSLLAAQLATSSELLMFTGANSYLDPHADNALADPEVRCVKVIKAQSQIYKRGDCRQINRKNLHEYSHIIYQPSAFKDIGMQGQKDVKDNVELGRIIVLLSSDLISEEHTQIIWDGVAIGVPSLLLAVLLSWRIGRSFSKPITELSDTVSKMAGGDLTSRVSLTSGAEIGKLQHNFNILASTIEENDYLRGQDLIHIKQAQEEAEAASNAKSQFLAVMSHELRTPMNGVMGMLQLLQTCDLSDEEDDYVSTAITSTEHLLTVVNDILDFSRIESGKMTIETVFFNLPELLRNIHQALEPIAKEKSLSFVLEIDPSLDVTIKTDPTRLRQVLINLIGNAIKFTESGFVKIIAQGKQMQSSRLELEIDIIDTGIGIPKRQLALMFDSFSQADSSTSRKYGGTGLGLAISKNLLLLMGGDLKVQSQLDVGSTFTCQLSVPFQVIKTTPKSAAPQGLIEEIDNKGTALLAEDNPVNQKVAVAMLKKMGLTIEVADNGYKAFELCKVNKYDLIFMDIQMPVMDGYQATVNIRNEHNLNNETPIIALTANAMSETQEKCLEIGMNGYLTKPFKRDQLLKAVQSWNGVDINAKP